MKDDLKLVGAGVVGLAIGVGASAMAIRSASSGESLISPPSVVLGWDANPEPTLAGYKVWEEESPGVYRQLADVTDPRYELERPVRDGMRVVLTAYSSDGIESPVSEGIKLRSVRVETTADENLQDWELERYLWGVIRDGERHRFWRLSWAEEGGGQ